MSSIANSIGAGVLGFVLVEWTCSLLHVVHVVPAIPIVFFIPTRAAYQYLKCIINLLITKQFDIGRALSNVYYFHIRLIRDRM